jgi:hypothetical protein
VPPLIRHHLRVNPEFIQKAGIRPPDFAFLKVLSVMIGNFLPAGRSRRFNFGFEVKPDLVTRSLQWAQQRHGRVVGKILIP